MTVPAVFSSVPTVQPENIISVSESNVQISLSIVNTSLTSNQEYLDYKSKYLDTVIPKDDGKKVTILDDIDFELELMYTDKINVDYIMNLIKSIDMKDLTQKDKDIKDILKKLENADNKDLRLKSDLIREFLNSIMPKLNVNSISKL